MVELGVAGHLVRLGGGLGLRFGVGVGRHLVLADLAKAHDPLPLRGAVLRLRLLHLAQHTRVRLVRARARLESGVRV